MRRLTRLLAILGLLAPATLPAQEPSAVTVTRGTVRDAVSNTPLVGAEVSALGTRGKTWTDNRGHFRLETPVRPDSVRIISIGFAEARVRASDSMLVSLDRLAVVLPELVTTGGQWTTRIAEAPAPIVTVQSAELVSRGVTAVDQAVAGLPGVQLQPTQPAGTSVSIRGIGEQRVLVLIDGEPAPGNQLETIDLSRLSTYDAERVEVTKGPTSSEFGSDALGGVINIVSRAPPEPFTVDANVTAGNLGRFTGDAAIGGTTGRLGTRVTASVRQLDWAAGVEDSTSFERVWNVGGTLRYAASPSVDLRMDVKYFYERQRWPVGAGFNGFQDNTGLSGWAEASFAAAGGRMRARAFGQAFDYKYRSARGDEPFANTGAEQSEDILRGLYAYERRLGPHTLGLGVQYGHREVTAPDRLDGGTNADDQTEVWAKDQARYGRFLYSAGLRYTDNSRWGDNMAPSFGVVWEPADALRLRGNVSRGFRPPNFKETGWRFGNPAFGYTIVGNPDLIAETSWAFSLGASWAVAGGVVVDADVYRNDIENLIDFFASSDANGTLFTPENIDQARTQGVELSARWATGPWSFQAGYNYLDAKNLTAELPLNRRAMHTGRFRTSRTWDRIAGLRVDVTGTLTGDAPIVESGLGTGGPAVVTGTQEALFTLDSRVAVTPVGDVELSFGVDNLFNAQPAGWLGAIERRVYLGMRTQWLPFGGTNRAETE
ncbi:MAG: TonB-dependent receptor domain-containing protein [Gemmatimonadales bacterium]